jgi:hypothetical protein
MKLAVPDPISKSPFRAVAAVEDMKRDVPCYDPVIGPSFVEAMNGLRQGLGMLESDAGCAAMLPESCQPLRH